MAEGFLLGPDLLARTRRTIETVEGGIIGSGFRSIPTVLEGETPTAGGPKYEVVVRVANAAYDASIANFPQGVEYGVGCAVDLPQAGQATLTNLGATTLASEVSAFDDLQTFTRSKRTILRGSFSFAVSEYFGIVTAISRNDDTGFTEITATAGGLVTCYVLAFSFDRRVTGAVPIPPDGGLFPKALWRPFATTSPAGSAYIVAFGGFLRLSSAAWPRVYEALVRL